jgi:hypothetical protein
MGVVKVNLGDRSYDIVIGAKLEELGDRMGFGSAKKSPWSRTLS